LIVQCDQVAAVGGTFHTRGAEKNVNPARRNVRNEPHRSGDIERRREDFDPVGGHSNPPLTGGKSASSSPSRRIASGFTYSRLIANATLGRKSRISGSFFTICEQADCTVASAERSSGNSAAPARSRR